MKSLSKSRATQESLRADVKGKLIVEQYKQLHADTLDSSRIRWQIIGIGGTLLVTLLVAAHSTVSLPTASILSGLALPISLLIFIAYRKEAYFENIYNETMEEIERRYGILHVQRDTLPQKAPELHYLVRLPITSDSFSSYTILLTLLGVFHVIAEVSFIYYFGEIASSGVATLVVFLLDFGLLIWSKARDQSQRKGWWQKLER